MGICRNLCAPRPAPSGRPRPRHLRLSFAIGRTSEPAPEYVERRNAASATIRCVFEQTCESLKLIGVAIGALFRPKGAQTCFLHIGGVGPVSEIQRASASASGRCGTTMFANRVLSSLRL